MGDDAILQVSRTDITGGPIKNIARRLLSENSYDYLAACYSSVRRIVEQRDLRRTIRNLQQARVNRVIAERSRENKDFFFIQVGACDGKSEDPIYQFVTRFRWRGILVEPVKHLFDKLVVTYQEHNNLFFENVAISSEVGQRTIYRVSSKNETGFVPWHERSSSFYKEHLLKQIDAIRSDFPGTDIIEEEVSCCPFSYLLSKYNVRQIDLLHVDAEGYDYEVIKMVPFERVKPNMIFYESEHLKPEDKLSCEGMLVAKGYKLIRAKDTFAYLP